jgi:hypothetical protein
MGYSTGSAGGAIHLKFTTRNTSGLPTTLSGSPVVSIYKDSTLAPSVAGVTLTVDFNGKTGLNDVAIDTTSDAVFYANGHNYQLVITAGTVAGTSVIGEVVGNFDLNLAPLLDAQGRVDIGRWIGNTVATPNVAGVPIVDIKYLLGTLIPTPATAGVMDVNAKAINNVATTPVTTIHAHIGTDNNPAVDVSGRIDVGKWVGTVVPAPAVAGVPVIDNKYLLGNLIPATATAGILDVNIKNINNIASTPVTTIHAHIGTDLNNIAQTGDSFVRIGATGSGLTSIPALVWDEPTANHQVGGSTGVALTSGATGGPGVQEWWKFDTTTTAADPGAGKFRFNTATPTTATSIYFDKLTSGGMDFGNYFRTFLTGDFLTVQDNSNAANWVKYTLSAAPIDNNGWWTVGVTSIGAGGVLPANNSLCAFLFRQAASSDPWSVLLPGSYTAGTAGNLLGTRPSAPAIATAILTDTTAGDFAVNGSPGMVLVMQLGGAFGGPGSSVYTANALQFAPTGAAAANLTSINGTTFTGPNVPSVLAPTGLDQIPVTPSTGLATTYPTMMVQLWRKFFKKSIKNATALTIKTYGDDGTTVLTTQPYSDDGAGNETLGAGA